MAKDLTNEELNQKVKNLELKVRELISAIIYGHGELSGLLDDDHSQYHNNTRGDARYIKKDGTTADVSADIPFNNNKLTGVKDPTADQDVATKKWVTDNFSPL